MDTLNAVIVLIVNINVITIFIIDTVSHTCYHCSFIPVDITITIGNIINLSVIVTVIK